MPEETTNKTTFEAEPPMKQVRTRLEKAESLVQKNVYIAATLGIIPIPLFDLAAISGVQLNMLYQLSKIYDLPFSKEAVKSTLSSLLGGGGSTLLAQPISYSIAKVIPGLGTAIGGLAMPVLGGAATYAVGKVFIQHFESGGTFLTFDPIKVKAYFAHLKEEGKLVAAEVLGTAT
jgi:uncharacterized protein (DUF697 family)